MKNVKIEITENRYTISVQLNGELFSETYEKTKFGSRRIEGSFEDEIDLNDEIVDALSNVPSVSLDLMQALKSD